MNFKFRIKDEEQSIQLQKILFELGFKWRGGSQRYSKGCLYIYAYEDTMQITRGTIKETFIQKDAEEIEL